MAESGPLRQYHQGDAATEARKGNRATVRSSVEPDKIRVFDTFVVVGFAQEGGADIIAACSPAQLAVAMMVVEHEVGNVLPSLPEDQKLLILAALAGTIEDAPGDG